MKIKSIYISAFGSLKDFTLDLSDGIQVIYGENEAGKTTVCEFIKAMFYGSKKTAGMVMSAREKYTPFDGATPAGRITFEHSGREFVLERQFRKSDATDKITLTDLATGKSEAAPSDIGKTLFGISLPAFERSMFISNTPDFSHDDNAQGEINQRLADTALTGQDNVSYQKVLSRIENARLSLVSKSGRTGSLVNDTAECNRLIEALEEADRAAHKKQEMVTALSNTQKKLAEITDKYNKAEALLESAGDIENANKLKEYLSLKDRLDSITKELTLPDGTIADEMFLKKFQFGFSKLDSIALKAENTAEELKRLKKIAAERGSASVEEIKEKIENTKSEIAKTAEKAGRLEKEIAEIKSEISETENEAKQAENAKKAVNLPLLIISVLLLLIGIALYIPIKSVIVPAAAGVTGIILLALAFILRPHNQKALQSIKAELELKKVSLSGKCAELSGANAEKSNLEAVLQNLNTALNFGVDDEQRIKETEDRLNAEQTTLKAETVKVLNFFSLPIDTDIEVLKQKAEALSGKADEQKQIKLRLSYLSRDLGGISYRQAEERLKSAEDKNIDFDIEKQKSLLKDLIREKSETENLKTQLETELKTGFRGMRNPEDLRREIAELKEKIAAAHEFYDAAGIAYEVLEESFIDTRKAFGSVLQSETANNLTAITAGAYKDISISKDFDIRAEKADTFGMHEVEFLSKGTKDQAYLALRLAVSKLLSEKEPLPVFLDDALSQYDDNRFLSALRFLREYAGNTQVCLFTCHEFVKEYAYKEGIKTVSL